MDEDRIEGKLKQAEGKLTGDEDRTAEGEAQETWATAASASRSRRTGRPAGCSRRSVRVRGLHAVLVRD